MSYNCILIVVKGVSVATKTLNIRLSKQIIEWIDSLVDKGLYNNRSEAIRDFARQFIEGKQ